MSVVGRSFARRHPGLLFGGDGGEGLRWVGAGFSFFFPCYVVFPLSLVFSGMSGRQTFMTERRAVGWVKARSENGERRWMDGWMDGRTGLNLVCVFGLFVG